MEMAIVRDKDGKELARIDPRSSNAQERIRAELKGREGVHVNIEEIEDGIDLLSSFWRK